MKKKRMNKRGNWGVKGGGAVQFDAKNKQG